MNGGSMPRTATGRSSALFLALVVTLFGAPAASNASDVFGFDPRSIGMGGAQVASANDYTAAYFNPSLLVLKKDVMFGVGFSWAQPVMSVAAQNAADSARLNPAVAPDFGGFTLGVLF